MTYTERYQKDALKFNVAPNTLSGSIHAALGLAGEVGEVVELIKKDATGKRTLEVDRLREEIGDVFWYLAVLCNEHQLSFEDCMAQNIIKLTKRYGHS